MTCLRLALVRLRARCGLCLSKSEARGNEILFTFHAHLLSSLIPVALFHFISYEREAIREKMAWKEIEDAQEIAKLKSELDWVNSEIELCEVAALDLSVAEKTERLALDQMHVIATLTEDIQVKSKIEKKYGVKAFDKDSFDERLKSMDDKILAMQANDMKGFGT